MLNVYANNLFLIFLLKDHKSISYVSEKQFCSSSGLKPKLSLVSLSQKEVIHASISSCLDYCSACHSFLPGVKFSQHTAKHCCCQLLNGFPSVTVNNALKLGNLAFRSSFSSDVAMPLNDHSGPDSLTRNALVNG